MENVLPPCDRCGSSEPGANNTYTLETGSPEVSLLLREIEICDGVIAFICKDCHMLWNNRRRGLASIREYRKIQFEYHLWHDLSVASHAGMEGSGKEAQIKVFIETGNEYFENLQSALSRVAEEATDFLNEAS